MDEKNVEGQTSKKPAAKAKDTALIWRKKEEDGGEMAAPGAALEGNEEEETWRYLELAESKKTGQRDS